jgi:hypothetical protein
VRIFPLLITLWCVYYNGVNKKNEILVHMNIVLLDAVAHLIELANKNNNNKTRYGKIAY